MSGFHAILAPGHLSVINLGRSIIAHLTALFDELLGRIRRELSVNAGEAVA